MFVVVNLINFLTPPHFMLFIEEPMLSQGSEMSCICVLGARVCSNLSFSIGCLSCSESVFFFHFVIDTLRKNTKYCLIM